MDAIINAILNTNKELLTFNRNNKRLNNIVCITYNGVEMELCQLRELVDMSREQMRRIIVEYNNQR